PSAACAGRRSLSGPQTRDEVVETRARDRQELREILPVALRDPRRALLADRARQIRERLIQLARRGDERVVAQRRDRRLRLFRGLARVEDPLHAVVQAQERQLPG